MNTRKDKFGSMLITGAGGLLGARMITAARDYRVFAHFHNPPAGNSKDDIFVGDLGDENHVMKLAEDIGPDIIINCAALANVDICETKPQLSYVANVTAVVNLIGAFPNAKLVQISTDYVFGDSPDRGSNPPKPDDPTGPMNIYGQHKLEAEKAALSASSNNLVVRVNTLIDHTHQRNIFRFVYDNLKTGKQIVGAADQVSNPISTFGAASLTLELIERKASGIFHLGGQRFISRYELACLIAQIFDLDQSLIKKVTTDTMPRPAVRPRWAGLDCRNTEKLLKVSMPEPGEELSRIKEEINRNLS